MPGKAKSDYIKAHIMRCEKELLIDHAIELYRAQPPGSRNRKGYRTLAEECSAAWNAQNSAKFGFHLKLSSTTLQARDEGRLLLSEKRAEDALLTPDEDALLTQFLQETANRGFPCNNKRIREAAVSILQRREPTFAEIHLGKGWHTRFIQRKKARKELASYWSRPLKSDRATAVNPHTHK